MTSRVSTATAESTTGQLARRLLARLDDNRADQKMAARFPYPAEWPKELRQERDQCWEQLKAILSSTAGGTK